ncbi:MAG: hypothetical protein O6930_00935 [Gammaproteobacteria bacterium]|nr:hypothetical protein [Gammaproteobacteria bacterium]
MIVSKSGIKKTPRWLRACVLPMAVALLPLGFSSAQTGDPEVEAQLEELGVDTETLDRIRAYLQENGITDDQIVWVTDGLIDVIAEVKSEGEDYELNPQIRDTFWAIGVTDEQIELIQGLARRLANLPPDDDRGGGEDDTSARIAQALMENGIAREQVRGVIGTLRPIVGEIQREGDAFELDAGSFGSLAGMGLTDEQIDFVVMLAQRLASSPPNDGA